MRVFIIIVLLFFTISCMHERSEDIVEAEGVKVFDVGKYATINFIFPERCLELFTEWVQEKNSEGAKINAEIYTLTPRSTMADVQYTALVSAKAMPFGTLRYQFTNFLDDRCYGNNIVKISAESVMYKNQELADLYNFKVPITNVTIEGETITFHYNDSLLELAREAKFKSN